MRFAALTFGSFLAYSPHGRSRSERLSVALRHGIKQDLLLLDGGAAMMGAMGAMGAVALAVRRLREIDPPQLSDLLAADVCLVPVPGCSPPLPRRAHRWAALRISSELHRAGFGCSVQCLLARRRAVGRSVTAREEGRPRPSPWEHYDSFASTPAAGPPPRRLTLVDDFITRGATVLGAAARLAEAFPQAEIRAFALVRTQRRTASRSRRQVFRALVDPIRSSVIADRSGGAWRRDP